MTGSARHTMFRWLLPFGVAALLIGGAVTVTAVTASAGASALPSRTAAQLLVDVQRAKLGALSGTVVQRADLGLPSLPGFGGANSSDLASLVAGTHTLRVWYDGTDKARVALLGTLGESDVIKNGRDLWTWSSRDNSATHRIIGADSSMAATPGRGLALDPTELPQTPQAAAAEILQAVDPSTLVTTDSTQTVAGRSVYQLILRPRATGGSLIDRIAVAVDGSTHLPLRVQVYSIGHAAPTFEIAFTSVDFSAPDPAQFTFNPPPGAQVTTVEPASPAQRTSQLPGRTPPVSGGRSNVALAHPMLVGSSWTTVLIASASTLPAGGQLDGVLQLLPKVSGKWGSGHLLAGTLFSVLVTDSGKVVIGAVRPTVLYSALSAK